MKFEKIEIEFEKFLSVDVIASSSDEGEIPTTGNPIDPTINNDPYENDKW